MAPPWREELSCPVCQDIFTNPVLLPCSHSFCEHCVQTWWTINRQRQCPVCKETSSTKVPPHNRVLKNLSEAFRQEVGSGVYCDLHGERLKLFCLDHQTPVCVVCRDSKQHKNHLFTPAEEAAEPLRESFREHVNASREKVKVLSEAKLNWEKIDEDIRNQVLGTEMEITIEFEKALNFLLQERRDRIASLKKDEEEKRKAVKEQIAFLTREVETLESTISTLEEGLAEADSTAFLLNAQALKEAAERPLPEEPQQVTGALIHVGKHLGNMMLRVWLKMNQLVSNNPVILDPNTAHPDLHLSEELTMVRHGPKQHLAATPERMKQHRSVLGCQGYTSGLHTWDVEVRDNPLWVLGVVADAHRTEDVASGLWMVRFSRGKFTAFSPSQPASVLPLKDNIWTVRVHLDWDRGTLSFLDRDTSTPIHTFTHRFSQKLFPYFSTWSNVPLKLLPVKLSIQSVS